MVSKHQSILGSGFNQISTSHQEVMKMIAELKDLVMNRVPIANSSPDEHVISDQLRPPPAPPHPQPHPFYSSEFSPPSLIPQFNTNEFTASYVFDESSAPNWVYGQSQFSPQIYNQQYWSPSYNPNHMSPLYSVDQQYYYSQPQPLVPHAPQHPYTLTVQTTLSTGQPYYTIEPTTVFENVHSFVDLRSGNMLMNVCESNDKLEVTTESTVKLDVEVVDKLEARVVCEGVPKNRMLVKDELGVKIEDRSVLETIDDMCEADCEIESEMKDEIRLEEDDRSPCEDVDDTSGFDCRILTEAEIGCEVEIRSEMYRSDNLTKAYTIIEDVDLSLKTLGMDYEQTTKEFHPSFSDSDRVKIVSDDAIERLAVSIQTLQEIKIQRMQRLQDLATYMLEPWNLMDTSIDAIETGVMDPAYILEQIELQISKVKDEARSRKEILEKVEKWMTRCEEECWRDEYNRDDNRMVNHFVQEFKRKYKKDIAGNPRVLQRSIYFSRYDAALLYKDGHPPDGKGIVMQVLDCFQDDIYEVELEGKDLGEKILVTSGPLPKNKLEFIVLLGNIILKMSNENGSPNHANESNRKWLGCSYYMKKYKVEINFAPMIPASDNGKFFAYGRVFAGKVSTHLKVRIKCPNYVPGKKKDFHIKSVQRSVIWMGKKLEIVEDVPCKNTVAIIGLDQFITKGAILAHEKELEAHPIEAMKFCVSPVVRVAVQCKVASDLSKLVEGLTGLAKSNSMVVYTTKEYGEHIVTGDVHGARAILLQMELQLASDSTSLSYWLNWRFVLCVLTVIVPMSIAACTIWKYESYSEADSKRNEQKGSWIWYADDAWRPCAKYIHPIWLMIFRIIAFCLISTALIVDVSVQRQNMFDYYTEWTFTLVAIYFGCGSLLSIYGCFQLHKFRTIYTFHNELDAEHGPYASLTWGEALNGVQEDKGLDHQEKYCVFRTAFDWGHAFQVLLQMTAGAVVLTDTVYWCIIFPCLTAKDNKLTIFTVLEHSLNVVLILGDTALNGLRFPWFRISYFVLLTGVYVIFEWISMHLSQYGGLTLFSICPHNLLLYGT